MPRVFSEITKIFKFWRKKIRNQRKTSLFQTCDKMKVVFRLKYFVIREGSEFKLSWSSPGTDPCQFGDPCFVLVSLFVCDFSVYIL